MATQSTPIFASSFLRQSSLHGTVNIQKQKPIDNVDYHWYNIQNLTCVEYQQPYRSSKDAWFKILSSISTRFIQVSWRILHDLQIAPPTNTKHLDNHDEWVMVEILYRGIKTVSCIQSNNNKSNDTLIHISPLIVNDLHLSYSFTPQNKEKLISLNLPNDNNNNNNNSIGLRSIDFHNFSIAKTVRFQLISSMLYDNTVNYSQIVHKYMIENKVNDIELMKDDYYVHHKCIWKKQIVAIPIINTENSSSNTNSNALQLRGRAALKHFYKNKLKQTNNTQYSIKQWIYIHIVDIVVDNDKDDDKDNDDDDGVKDSIEEYYRILPAHTTFIQIDQTGNMCSPRLCEYYSSVLLNESSLLNSNNLFYNYRIPLFYSDIVDNILFPHIYCNNKFNSNIIPSFLIICNSGHRLRCNLMNISCILGINYVYKNCIELIGRNMNKTVKLLLNYLNASLEFESLLLHLDLFHLFEYEAHIHSYYNNAGKIKPILPIVNVLQTFISSNKHCNIIIFASANNITSITRELRSIFTYEHIIESIFDDNGECDTEIIPQSLTKHICDLSLINGLNTTQLFEINSHHSNIGYQECIDNIRYRQSLYNINLNINISSIPSVYWSDVGGLESAKKEIFNIIELPLKYPDLFRTIKQSIGILLYGPPGTGKTLLAKAIATEFKMNFISIKGPELLNMYVGQSEENIRNVFNRAIQSRPAILFFDEIDALVPSRGRSSDGGNVMDRVVSQLLTEIDSISNKYNGEIFIIAATNRPDLLDASLLRPSRLDKQIYLGVPRNPKDKFKIIKALTRKFKFINDNEKDNILNQISCSKSIELFTGADLYALCCDAMMNSLKLLIEELKNICINNDNLSIDLLLELIQMKNRNSKLLKNINDDQWKRIKDFDVKLDLIHFQKVLKNIKPSLTEKELKQYQSIHRQQNK